MAADIFIKDQFIEIPWQVFSELYDIFYYISQQDRFAIQYPNIIKMLNIMNVVNSNPCNGCFDLGDFLVSIEDVEKVVFMLQYAINQLQHKFSFYVISELIKLKQYLLFYSNGLK